MARQETRTVGVGVDSDRGCNRRGRRGRILLLAVAAGAGTVAMRTSAQVSWNAASGNWNNPANWAGPFPFPLNLPLSGYAVTINNSDSVARTITYDYPSPLSLAVLTMAQTGSGSTTLSQFANSLASANEIIGTHVNYNQSGGTNTVLTALQIGDSTAGSGGTYNLSGSGQLNVNGDLIVAPGSSGKLNQIGGVLTAKNYSVGLSNTGTVTQSGGSATATILTLGASQDPNVSSNGLYTLTSGTLSTQGTIVGVTGFATFEQSGGTHTVNGTLSVSGSAISDYRLFNAGVLNTTNTTIGGFLGNSTFTQSGGTHTVSALLTINYADNRYRLTGGTLNAAVLNNNLLDVSGGTLVGSVTNNVQIELSGTGVISGAVTNNVVSANQYSDGNATFDQSGGTFNGSLKNDSFVTQSGGVFAGALLNNGTFTYNAGAFGGSLTNNGKFVFNAPFTALSGLVNNASIVIGNNLSVSANGAGLVNSAGATIQLTGGTLSATGSLNNFGAIGGFGTIGGPGSLQFTNAFSLVQSGGNLTLAGNFINLNSGNLQLETARALILVGSGLTNTGSLALGGGQVMGPGKLINGAGGVIQGSGSILAPLQNDPGGTLVSVGGLLTFNGAFTNGGSMTLGGVTSIVNGSAFTNSGVIQGVGTVANSVTNAGSIEAIGGILQFTGSFNNAAAGSINVGSGAKVLLTSGLPNSAGAVNLTGGTFDTNGKPFSNTGTAGGYGVLRAGSMTNSGTLTSSGGSLDVFGPVNNTATGKFIITGLSVATFHGNVSGTVGTEIRVSTNSAAVFLAPVNGPITFTGTGAKYFESGLSATGPLAAGGVTVVQQAASLTVDNVREASLTVNGQLTVRVNGTAAGASKVAALTVGAGARIDLADNTFIVDYGSTEPSPASSVRSLIVQGRSGGTWKGNSGITSSVAAASPSDHAIGYADASAALGLSIAQTGVYQGQTVDSSSLIVRYTLNGDSNLDGAVGFADLVSVAQHYDTIGTGTWFTGDFDYDGNVGFTDLVALAQHYDQALPAAAIPESAPPDFAADWARAQASVPEPGTGLLMGLSGSTALLRRRQRARN